MYIYKYTHINVYIYIHVYIYTYVYIYIYIYTYIYYIFICKVLPVPGGRGMMRMPPMGILKKIETPPLFSLNM
jgi:hypothetical protein